MRKFALKFAMDDSGATAIEYALIASGIGVTLITAIGAIAGSLNGLFNNVGTNM